MILRLISEDARVGIIRILLISVHLTEIKKVVEKKTRKKRDMSKTTN